MRYVIKEDLGHIFGFIARSEEDAMIGCKRGVQ